MTAHPNSAHATTWIRVTPLARDFHTALTAITTHREVASSLPKIIIRIDFQPLRLISWLRSAHLAVTRKRIQHDSKRQEMCCRFSWGLWRVKLRSWRSIERWLSKNMAKKRRSRSMRPCIKRSMVEEILCTVITFTICRTSNSPPWSSSTCDRSSNPLPTCPSGTSMSNCRLSRPEATCRRN